MKINYGIHIGENNASIAKVIDGVPVILKSNTLKDSMPICVSINRRNTIHVGDSALNTYKAERFNTIRNWGKHNNNTFIGFNRTLGTDTLYYSANAERNFTSTELVAEVIKELCSFEKDEQILAAVITVPVGFRINQIDAIMQAAELAGIEHVDILQESIAAAMGYGLNIRKKNGFWLVFDFRRGSFTVSLLKVTDGVCQVLDNDIDNYLGGECIDDAIVDEIIMPYLKRNFAIDKLLRDNTKSIILRNTMRFYAKDIKKTALF